MAGYSQRFVAIGSGSTATSNAWFAGDFRLLTVSVASSASLGPNNVAIQASNADGLQAGDLGGPSQTTGWSNITLITAAQMALGVPFGTAVYTFDPPGYRWVRSFVSPTLQSVASAMTVIFNGVRF